MQVTLTFGEKTQLNQDRDVAYDLETRGAHTPAGRNGWSGK